MPRFELEYPKKPFSTVNRYASQASYSLKTIHGIVNAAQMLHVSFQPSSHSPFPATLPMIGQMGSFSRPSADLGDVLDLYLHGYVSSRLMNTARTKEKAGDANQEEEEQGLPVTVAASHVDGLVLSLTPYSHNYNYRSAILFGYATIVTDADEKLYGMQCITDSVAPGRWDNTRVPPNAAEMQSTSVLRVRIVGGSAKIRTGMPNDERRDLADEPLLDRVWAGVIPVYPTLGTPIPADYNRVSSLPGYLADFYTDFNNNSQDYAKEAAKETVKDLKE